MTPHISAKLEQIAKIVLMPGDPLRAKWIAENYLEKYELVNEVRGMLAYTGYYKNKRVTIFAHGMGIPSAGIYTYELFNFYKVDTIIRIGSCGSYKKDINVGDLVVVRDTVSDSVYADNLGVKVVDQTLVAPTRLLNLALSLAKQNNIDIKPVRTACSEAFYSALSLEQQAQLWKNPDVIEMESFALHTNAIKLNKQAICLLTVSDSFVTKKEMSAMERQTSLVNMIKLGLEMAVALSN